MTARNKRLTVIIAFVVGFHILSLLQDTKEEALTLNSQGQSDRMQIKLIKAQKTVKPTPQSTAKTNTPAPPPPQHQDTPQEASETSQDAQAKAGEKADTYDALVATKIEQNKTYPPIALRKRKTGAVKVGFVINALGELQSSAILQKSPHSPFNTAALNAIKNAAPFPPFPKEITEETRAYSTTITFKLSK